MDGGGSDDGGNVNQVPLNLQHQVVEDQNTNSKKLHLVDLFIDRDEEIISKKTVLQKILHESTQRWLETSEMHRLMLNGNLFQVINPTRIPEDEQGLYRVDNESMRDKNRWLHSSLQRQISHRRIMFHIRLLIGFDIDFEDFYITLYRIVSRKSPHPDVLVRPTCVHYMYRDG